ncbi:PAAR domain-containing protein [Herbaspirillum huttiense]|uniref:PAAR domain-containing protein n=1 Tax=Herbaspirillum huttiense TaxID=863372 RepID=UPI002176A6D5|nr:PAAR domain-containing protein [Herbaspirillum huttiense]UWE19019.1 PAAR domain-containing protein [Herbaspirillum huttiense]
MIYLPSKPHGSGTFSREMILRSDNIAKTLYRQSKQRLVLIMKIVGWIRYGDKTACGGTVMQGDPTCISYGKPYAFHGALIACRKKCIIADGYPLSTLTNGRAMAIHGMKSSAGCPIQSTLNNIDGVGVDDNTEIPLRYVQDDTGEWIGKMNEGYDQHFVLNDEITGEPLANRHYRMKLDGRVIEGKTDSFGKTEKVFADDPKDVTIEIMREGYSEK